MSNYFYCRIRPEGLLYDAERDMLAIATFLVSTTATAFRNRTITKEKYNLVHFLLPAGAKYSIVFSRCLKPYFSDMTIRLS